MRRFFEKVEAGEGPERDQCDRLGIDWASLKQLPESEVFNIVFEIIINIPSGPARHGLCMTFFGRKGDELLYEMALKNTMPIRLTPPTPTYR